MYILFTVILAFFLMSCQAAPAATPPASPTVRPSETPRSTTAATLAPTSTLALTPTVSPAEMKRRAAPICENSFSALVETGSLIPPFAVMKKQVYADPPSWELAHQLPHLSSLSAADVQTVFCISETRTHTGSYTDGSPAYQFFWDVRVVSWPGGRVIGKNSFTGSPPPRTKVFASGAGEGLFPDKQFAAWVFNRVEHPSFLYFEDAVTAVAVSPKGSLAAFGTAIASQLVDEDYRAQIYLFDPSDMQTELGTSAFLDVLDGHQGMVTSLAFSPDGSLLASSGYDLFIKFWDVGTGALLGQVSLAETPNSLAFSPDGSQLAVASNLQISFVDPVSMQIERSIPVSSGNNLVFSPDGNQLFVSTPFRVTVIDASAGNVALEFPDPVTLVPTVTMAQDGTVLGVTYETPDTVENFTLSPDGAQVVTYTIDRAVDSTSGLENVRMAAWDAKTGKFLREIKFAAETLQTIQLSPGGTLLAVANDDEVWVWETASWQIIRKFAGHVGLIEDLAFSPDGTSILSAGRDGTIRVWPVDQ